jgi:Ca2+/Na+ antiporter
VPGALASVAVVRMGQADVAVSNAMGSYVLDILLGFGFH